MKNTMLFLLNPQGIETIFLSIALVLAVLAALVAGLKFYFDLRGLMEDIKNRFTGKEKSQVRRTIVKTIAKDNQTQTIKLHTLRVFQDMDFIENDPSPQILDEDDTRFVKISDRFSIPGRVIETPERKLRIDFKKDEKPKARQDYTYVSSHIANETMQDMWGEPGIVISQPVGRDSLVVEFFCPPRWRYRRNGNGKPLIKVYTMKVLDSVREEDRQYVPDERISIDGESFAFDSAEGPIDWFRVTVKKPPQDCDINVDWVWDDATKKLYQELEAAKAPKPLPPGRQGSQQRENLEQVSATDGARRIRGTYIRGTNG